MKVTSFSVDGFDHLLIKFILTHESQKININAMIWKSRFTDEKTEWTENHLGYEITASFKSKLKADGLVYGFRCSQ